MEQDEGLPICQDCLEPYEPGTSFCPKCGAAVSSFATVGPIEQIHALGDAARRAPRRPVKGVVFWSLWGACFLMGIPWCLTVIFDFEMSLAALPSMAVGVLWWFALAVTAERRFAYQRERRRTEE